MSQGREMFALEWVKGEVFEALERARQALESFAEFGRDETRMRTCLTSLHQVHGTLVMLELPGVALLADHLERLAQGLLNKQFADDRVPCEELMQGILELPVRLENIQEGGQDTESAVLPFVNRIRKLLDLDEIAPPRPVQFVADEAALDRFERIDGRGKIRRIRAAYQGVLLALLKGEDDPHFIDTLKKVGLGLERICQDTPSEILWQSFGEFVDSLRTATRPLSADTIKVLRRLDAEIRRFAQDGVDAILAPVPERLLVQLMDAAQLRGRASTRLQEMRRRMEPANDGELIASGRDALVAASRVLTEELAGVKDQLDLLVRGEKSGADELTVLAQSLHRIAATCGVLGFESSRLIVLDQMGELERFNDLGELDRNELFGVAAALVQVEENLASVSLLTSHSDRAPGVSDAERQVLVESRAGLEEIKQAIVNFVGNGFAPEHLEGVASKLQGISAALLLTGLARPAALLDDCRAFLTTEIAGLSTDGQPAQWERLDRFADCLSGIDYHLERLVTNIGAKADDILDVVERSLVATGYLGHGERMRVEAELREAKVDESADATDSETSAVVEIVSPMSETEPADWDRNPEAVEVASTPEEVIDSTLPAIVWEASSPESTEPFEVEEAVEGAVEEAVDEVTNLVHWQMPDAEASGEEVSEPSLDASENTSPMNMAPAMGDRVGEVIGADADALTIPQDLTAAEEPTGVDAAEISPAEHVIGIDEVFVAPEVEEALLLSTGGISTEDQLMQIEFDKVTHLPELDAESPVSAQTADEVEVVPNEAPRPATLASDEDLASDSFDAGSDRFEEETIATALVDERADAELRAVFSEEVDEVLRALDDMFILWQEDQSDQQALREIRRGFHTLKGSGRMVGAQQIGELAWAIENMLNRVLEGTLDSLGEILLMARSARELMPELLTAFNLNTSSGADKAANLIDMADVLASGGSLTTEEDEVVDFVAKSPKQEEASIFLAEAREHVALLRGKTGRRRVELDDELLMSLHTFVGSANLMAPGALARSAELLYQVARAAQAQALRGPNVDVDVARLFQEAAEVIASSLDLFGTGASIDEDAHARMASRAQLLLNAADETPAEEMLLGLIQLEAVLGARHGFDAWRRGEPGPGFVDQLVASMRAILGATSRPQITDIAKALIGTIQQINVERPLAEHAYHILVDSCERLLQVIDAIGTDQILPRVDDVVTLLGDLLDSHAGKVSDTRTDDKPVAVQLVDTAWSSPVTAEAIPSVQPNSLNAISAEDLAQLSHDAQQMDPELAGVFFEEAEELLEALDSSIQAFVQDSRNGLPLENILRGLHTLKGGARLTGLVVIGDRVHHFESFLGALQFGRDDITESIQRQAQERFDELSTLVQRAREIFRRDTDAVPADAVPAVSDSIPSMGAAASVPKEAEWLELSSPRASVASAQEAAPQDMIRVRANLLENLVNLAGESSILRARVEQGINDFTVAIDEMGTTIERQREQLRRLEIETEAQVLFRTERMDRHQEQFDPLEMDRYSQLQQLSRALAESASDMLDLKDTLLFKSREAETILLQQARVNTELQEGLMRTRMVPFSRLLPRLRRIVRQVAQEVNKEVDFQVFNAEGELDRNLLERMVPPLEHMLRNAVDHGIESTMVRRSFGKPVPGRIDLRLSREGGDIVIEIVDDGMGIDIETVRAKAIERGLLRPDAMLSDDEVLDFVLAPGFSTAKSVTQISGRGVGLDVVNSEVKQLGGSVSIFSSPGKGTRFVLRVPFTVSVNRALMVTVGDDQYAIPLNTIEGIVLVDNTELQSIYASDNKMFEYAGLAYRVRYLGRYLGRDLPNAGGRGGVPLVLVRAGEHAMAVAVDGVQGSREIVVKSLGPQFAGVGGISGATILGDGSVVVILDLLALIRSQGRDVLTSIVRDATSHIHTRCVMVVDDSVTVRKVTTRLLERQGMDVIVAKDGVEAMSLLGERTPDIMLLDIEMPRMDGFEVARQMRHDPRIARIPIIMISSRTGAKHKQHAQTLGIDRFLGKPFQENELLAAIDELDHRR